MTRASDAAPLRGSLELTRSAAAAHCPDRAHLADQIDEIAARPAIARDGTAEVRFLVTIAGDPAGGLVAEVSTSGARQGERTLVDRSNNCKVLAESLAVTMAMTLDDVAGTPVAPTISVPRHEAVSTLVNAKPWWKQRFLLPAIDAPQLAPQADERIPPLTASVAPLFDTVTLTGSTAGMLLQVDSYVPYVTFGFAFVYLPTDFVELADFEATYSYAGGRVRACVRSPEPVQFGLALCSRASAGRRTATLTKGSAQAAVADGGHVSLGLSTELSRRVAGPLGLFAELGFDGAAYRDSVELSNGVGQTVSLPERPIGIEVSGGLRFWLEPEEPDPPSRPVEHLTY